jgi:glycosyltransferase involved in cell wall biosynthesis
MPINLVIQIPCYNEEQTISDALREIPRSIPGVDKVTILIIDDGSHDNTARVALQNGADYVIQHPVNRGLARAFITGIQTALALGADIIVNTDADNQYPGKYIPDLIAPILSKRANLVIGDRQVEKNQHFSPIKRMLEWVGSWFMRIVSDTDVPDAPSGFRAFSRYTALRMQVYNRYSYTLETLIQAGKDRMNIAHLQIETNPATRPSRLHKGIFNFIWRQAGTIIRSYVLYQPLKTFAQVSIPFLLSSAILIGRFLYLYLTHQAGSGRYLQSVSIGGTLGIFGILLVMMGLIGDAVRTNRQTMEEILVAQRDNQRLTDASDSLCGCKFLKKTDINREL